MSSFFYSPANLGMGQSLLTPALPQTAMGTAATSAAAAPAAGIDPLLSIMLLQTGGQLLGDLLQDDPELPPIAGPQMQPVQIPNLSAAYRF